MIRSIPVAAEMLGLVAAGPCEAVQAWAVRLLHRRGNRTPRGRAAETGGALIPGYMLPAKWEALDGLPKNVNGKIDRPALRDRFRPVEKDGA